MVNPNNSHAARMKTIEGKFSNGQQLSREQLITIMFGPADLNYFEAAAVETMQNFHPATRSQSDNMSVNEAPKYKDCWEEKYNWIEKHPFDDSMAICIICPSAIAIKKGLISTMI